MVTYSWSYMLKGYEKLKLVDVYEKDTGVTFEVNWNPEDEKTNECKIIRVALRNNKEVFVKKDMFMSFLWVIGNNDEHMKMIPQTIRRSKWYETVVSVKAKKDIRKGDNITFPLKITLPTEEQEVIGTLNKKLETALKSKSILLPTKYR